MKVMIMRITDSGVMLRSSMLIKELIKSNNEVVVVTPRVKDYHTLIDMGCKHIEVRIEGHGTNPLTDIKLYNSYKRIIKNEMPNIVLLYTTKPNLYGGLACRIIGIPVVMNISGMGSALGNKGPLQKLLIGMYRFACGGKNMKTIFFQNDDSREFFDVRHIGDKRKYKSLPGSGVDLVKFPVQPFPNADTVDFLFVARVMKEKGIEEYIESAKNVRKLHPEAVFHVLGGCDETYRDRLEEETRQGTILYHGRVDNMPAFEKISQCTIQPSYYPEGISNVILEAAASGRPVITTDHPGCREGVDDGVTGYIVPIKDSKSLTKAIIKFLALSKEERIQMGLCGRKKMEQEFDVKKVTQAYLNIINS